MNPAADPTPDPAAFHFPPVRPPLAAPLVAAFAAAELALHLIVLAVTPYGIHRDAFLYFAMGDHLRLWRMDFPPFIAIMGNIQTALFGHTLTAARVFPALEGAAILVLAALIARELGGGRFAQGLAMLPMLCAGIFLRPANLFQPVVLDQVWWTLALYALLRVGRARSTGDGRAERNWWLAFGAAMGFGLLTKFSILFIGFSVLCAIVATPLRRSLSTPWPWVAAAVAFVIGSPSIVGQVALHFPVVGQMADLQAGQLVHVSWLAFVASQPFMVGFAGFPLGVAGAVALVAWAPLRAYRAAGWAIVFVFLLLLLLHGKAYYVGPIYPTLLAAGAVWLERMGQGPAPRVRAGIRWLVPALMVVEGAIAFPVALPILAPESTARYIVRAGMDYALGTNWGGTDLLPQDFADQLGWEQQARVVARVYHALPPDERRVAVVAGDNYGEAGALEFYAGKYGLPEVISGAGSFWFFGPGSKPGRVLVALGTDSSVLASMYGDVRRAATIRSPWSVPEERYLPVWVARDQKKTLQQIWPLLPGRH